MSKRISNRKSEQLYISTRNEQFSVKELIGYKACSSAYAFSLNTQAALLCITPQITSQYFPFNRKPVERKYIVVKEQKLTQNSNLICTVTTR